MNKKELVKDCIFRLKFVLFKAKCYICTSLLLSVMKKYFFLLLTLLCLTVSAQTQTFMSYNIRNCIGMDRVQDLDRVAEVINGAGPDIVAIQEVDSVTGRSGGRDILSNLGALCGMHPTFAAAIDYDGGRYGIGILSKELPISVQRYPLPGREETRALVVAEFEDFYFACTHLSLTHEDCLASVDILNTIASKAGKPFFLSGDFNATPDSDVIDALQEHFVILTNPDELTFPADKPDRTLDYIMVSRKFYPSITAGTPEVVNAPMASDHRPQVVKITFSEI